MPFSSPSWSGSHSNTPASTSQGLRLMSSVSVWCQILYYRNFWKQWNVKEKAYSCYRLVLFLSQPCFLSNLCCSQHSLPSQLPRVTRVTKDPLYICSGEGRADKDILSWRRLSSVMDGTAKDKHPHSPTPQEVIYKPREWARENGTEMSMRTLALGHLCWCLQS